MSPAWRCLHLKASAARSAEQESEHFAEAARMIPKRKALLSPEWAQSAESRRYRYVTSFLTARQINCMFIKQSSSDRSDPPHYYRASGAEPPPEKRGGSQQDPSLT